MIKRDDRTYIIYVVSYRGNKPDRNYQPRHDEPLHTQSHTSIYPLRCYWRGFGGCRRKEVGQMGWSSGYRWTRARSLRNERPSVSLSLSLSIFLVVSVIRPLPVLLYSSPGVDLSSTLSCMYISDTQPQHVHITLHMEGNLLIPCARMLYLSTYDPIPRNF